MNRLILVGNGFDLAHQMKTSYKDFLLDYLNRSFIECYKSTSYSDSFMTLRRNNLIGRNYLPFEGTDNIDYFRKFFGLSGVPERNAEGVFIDPLPRDEYKVKVTDGFVKRLFHHCCEYNWVDIENEYYAHLKWILKNNILKEREEDLRNLNAAFKTLSELLQNYLSNLPEPPYDDRFTCLIADKIKRNEVVTEKLLRDTKPLKNLVLNFNYTTTIEHYITKLRDSYEIQINYIHGKLGFDKNPIIFGFGDEHDEDYSLLEKDANPAFLAFMKSFWYFKTRNYHELIRFIEGEDFQVVIAGHSCGLSDRTMLKMILEHANCKSVKIYYYENDKGNNYGILTQELSRHFSNKSDMRKKIVPLPFCSPLPQVSIPLLKQKIL